MNRSTNGLKLLLTYNIKPDQLEEYYEFVLGRYVPVMQAMGLEMSEAWHTLYGNYPDRLVGFVSQDEEAMMDLIHRDAWARLNEQLEEYVTDFSYKVIPYELGFQL